jgi:hypothetical protein
VPCEHDPVACCEPEELAIAVGQPYAVHTFNRRGRALFTPPNHARNVPPVQWEEVCVDRAGAVGERAVPRG